MRLGYSPWEQDPRYNSRIIAMYIMCVYVWINESMHIKYTCILGWVFFWLHIWMNVCMHEWITLGIHYICKVMYVCMYVFTHAFSTRLFKWFHYLGRGNSTCTWWRQYFSTRFTYSWRGVLKKWGECIIVIIVYYGTEEYVANTKYQAYDIYHGFVYAST